MSQMLQDWEGGGGRGGRGAVHSDRTGVNGLSPTKPSSKDFFYIEAAASGAFYFSDILTPRMGG